MCFKALQVYKEPKIAQRVLIEKQVKSEFIPQVGDFVVFIFNAYEFYLKSNPYVPLLDVDILQYVDPTLMKIENIEYVWPLMSSFDLIATNVCMKVFLKVVGRTFSHCVYYIFKGERFLVLFEEYEAKLWEFQNNPIEVYTNYSEKVEKVLEIKPFYNEFLNSS